MGNRMKKYSNYRYSGSPGHFRICLGAKGPALRAEMNLQFAATKSSAAVAVDTALNRV
jgi:hypothetical protein